MPATGVDEAPDELGQLANRRELQADLDENLRHLRSLFGEDRSPDLVIREFPVLGQTRGAAVYLSTLVDPRLVGSQVLRPILASNSAMAPSIQVPLAPSDVRTQLEGLFIANGRVSTLNELAGFLTALSHGQTGILIEGEPRALMVQVSGYDKRAVGPPETEVVIHGPHEGFVEAFDSNLSLIRRRVATPLLRLEKVKVGHTSETEVGLLYIQGLANPALVAEARRRLEDSGLDAALDTQYIEELIEDQSFTIFPQLYSTERPDVAAANLLEGRIALLVNGSPFVLIAPATMNMFLQSADDYYNRWTFGSIVRPLRWLMMLITIYFTAIYVAVVSFSQSMLPTGLLISFAAAREKVPFTVLTEALIMEAVFEVLREAGIRLPRQIGQTISIVGVLVIGQAAVQASIISAPMVILVAFSGIASFVVPQYAFGLALRILRFPMILAGGIFGLFGIVTLTVLTAIHLLALRSFGVPYLAGLSPVTTTSPQDTLVRLPHWLMRRRPRQLDQATTWRNAPAQMPRGGRNHGGGPELNEKERPQP
ncbi:MAG TPA: spore germination protein [Limnochordia bacterium]|nr:spore germination protein [Limnochordia bacterium]